MLTSNSSRRKLAILLRFIDSLTESRSCKAVNMGGLIVLGRPAPFDGALVDPKASRFERMRRTVRAEQRAILAISSSLSASPCDLLSIIF